MWSQGEGLVIVQVGMMAVYSAEGEEMGHLIDGDFFGELTLITNREIRTSAVIAITPCSVRPNTCSFKPLAFISCVPLARIMLNHRRPCGGLAASDFVDVVSIPVQADSYQSFVTIVK